MSFGKKPSALPWIAFVCKEAYNSSKLFVQEFHMDHVDVISYERRQYILRTTKIRFDLALDSLVINHRGLTADDAPGDDRLHHVDYLKDLHNGPFALAIEPEVNVILDMVDLAGHPGETANPARTMGWLTVRPHWDCLVQRSHCTVLSAITSFYAAELEIRKSGLFGMFGEERSVFVDINDTVKIDQYESYKGFQSLKAEPDDFLGYRWSYFPKDADARNRLPPMGARRYASYGRAVLDSEAAHGEDVPTPPTVPTIATLHSIAEQDAASALFLIKQSWLEANHCFEPAGHPLVPWTGDVQRREWDDEHHVAKHWLSKLPTFSFVVMYQVTERDRAMFSNIN